MGESAVGAAERVGAPASFARRWSAGALPSNDGGSPITQLHGHAVHRRPTAQTPVHGGQRLGDERQRSRGLTNGTAYTFTVKATNAAGASPESAASAAATPQDTVFDFTGTPADIDSGDTTLRSNSGSKFTADTSGR